MNKKRILVIVLAVIVGVLAGFGFYNANIDNSTEEIIENAVEEIQEVIVTEETQELAEETIEATQNNEDLSTTEVLESTEEDEQTLEEEDIEVDAQVEQENIAWEGSTAGDGTSLLGAYQGLTYYNQTDSRWGSLLYTITGSSSQTIASSGCRTNCCCNCCI